jgi:hypothetical protein
MSDSEISGINQDIIALWQEHYGNNSTGSLWPLIYPIPQTDGLAVIGCNPSEAEGEGGPVEDFQKTIDKAAYMRFLMRHEAEMQVSYALYFKVLRKISNTLSLKFQHLDLFLVRDKDQSKMKSRILIHGLKLNEFGKAQFGIAMRILRVSRPRIILVANKFASDLCMEEWRLEPMDSNGIYWKKIDDKKIPVFFSGMLSGQRALDTFSRERLIWHMRKALKLA